MIDHERPIQADDELPHTPVEPDFWRENWWLCFFDHRQGVRGIIYSGVQPLIKRGFVLIAIFRNDRPLYILDDHDISESNYAHAEGRIGPVTNTCIQPMESWRVDLDTPYAKGSFDWQAINDPYDWNWGAVTKSRHYEQPGMVKGRLTVGDETFDIEGMAQRDRAWGHRPIHDIRAAWSSRVLFDENDYQHAAVITAKTATYMFGYRVKDGRRMSMDRLRLTPTYAYPGGPPLTTELAAWSGDEQIADQQVHLVNVVPRVSVSKDMESHQFFTFSDFRDGPLSCAGQMDHWWSVPRIVGDVFEKSGNDGVWVKR